MTTRADLVARNRKAAARRQALLQKRLEARMADCAPGQACGDFTVREILERVRANAARSAA